ncbi:MAG: HD domain-containing protein [Erysipelotrichaceae bacterium]|nr:HD domain-containing protein [Erysipelotrichaceae bacterium]
MIDVIQVIPLADTIFKDIIAHGGKVYIVGGTVRDFVLTQMNHYQLVSKDIDLEIYHLSYDELKKILSKYGKVNTYGKSFAILGLSTLPGYDFALPRKETKTGHKHQDFDVIIDSELPLEKAVERRDVTMNALMYDYSNYQIIDLVGGVDDIHQHVIRMVNKNTFQEDPLRILRIANFIARFEMSVDNETKQYCIKMVKQGMLHDLSEERIYEEYKKILMSNHPSLGFQFLKEIDALPCYLKNLINCPQRSDYHPEGDVFNHTMLVLDLAATCKQYSHYPEAFMWSALLHDIGKPIVTNDQGQALQHELAGLDVFKDVTIITNKKMREYIKAMIHYHMYLMILARGESRDMKYLKFLKTIDNIKDGGCFCLEDLFLMTICDYFGRGYNDPYHYEQFLNYIKDKVNRLGDCALEPIISGQDLIDNAFDDHRRYGEILDKAYHMQLQGMTKEKIMELLKRDERKYRKNHG